MGRRASAWTAVALTVVTAAWAAPSPGQGAGERQLAVSIELTGTVDPATAGWIDSSLEDAREDAADLVIVRLDTPGGLVESMREIVQDLLASPVPVVVHVSPSGARAASAGLFVTQAADVAVMAPGTNIGAATPVSIAGGETDEVLGRKIRNDAAAYVRALAETHGRDAELAERMVRDAVSVTAQRALDAGLIDLIADERDLLRRLDAFTVQGPQAGRLDTSGMEIDRRDMPWHVEAQQFLVNPSLAYLLLVGGLLLIGVELLSPGLVGPGLFGGVAFALGLYATAQLPVTVVGALLLLLGLGALIAETQIASGVLGVAAVVALVAGGLLLYDTDSEVLAVSVPAALATGVLLGGLVVFAAGKAVTARRIPVRGEPGDLVGRTASVRKTLDPDGQVYVRGALWRASARTGAPIPAGATVVIEDVDRLTLLVRPATHTEQPTKEPP